MSMLFEQKKALETISLDYLYEGLVVQDDIYNHDGTLLLVAKGATLTDSSLKGLKRFNSSQQNIKVTSSVRQQLMNRGVPPKLTRESLETSTGYLEIKDQTENILTVAQITNSVPYEQVCDAGNLVLDRIDVTEPAVLFQCINAGNEVDECLYRHSSNVAILNALIGKWAGLDEKEIEDLVLLGLVHDIGKTRVPQEILNSPGRLTNSQFEMVKLLAAPRNNLFIVGDDDHRDRQVGGCTADRAAARSNPGCTGQRERIRDVGVEHACSR